MISLPPVPPARAPLPFRFSDGFRGKFFLGHFVAPLAKGPLRKFHDVAFVDQGHAGFPATQGVLNGPAHQTPGSAATDGFDADPGIDLQFFPGFFLDPADQLPGLRGLGRPLKAGIHILGVFAENYHIHQFRPPHGAGNSLEVPDRTQAYIKVQLLTQLNVEAAQPLADRGGQGAL